MSFLDECRIVALCPILVALQTSPVYICTSLPPSLPCKALDTIDVMEKKLAQEHQLRKTADNFLLDLQTSRQQAVSAAAAVKSCQEDIAKHCKSIK